MRLVSSFAAIALGSTAIAAPQEASEPPPPPLEPAKGPVSSPPDWNVGAGLGLFVPTFETRLVQGILGGGGGLLALGGLAASVPSLPSPRPRLTTFVERRLSPQLFLTFQAAASYSLRQSELDAAISASEARVEGGVGVRRVFNPGGVIEVSWFAAAEVGFVSTSSGLPVSRISPSGGLVQALQRTRGQGLSVGAFSGLTLERELVSGLALRLSSSLVGVEYATLSATSTVEEQSTPSREHSVDVGLRLSPALELRYAL